MEVVIGLIFAAIVIGIVFIYSTLLSGLILYKFWGWFILPVFTTLPALTFVQAIGIMFVIGLFKSNFSGENIKDEYKKNTWEKSLTTFLSPWFVLFFGWLAWTIWLQ